MDHSEPHSAHSRIRDALSFGDDGQVRDQFESRHGESTTAGKFELVPSRLGVVTKAIEDSGRDPASITIVAVTKALGIEAVSAAMSVGLSDLGENYAAELVAKAQSLQTGDGAPRPPDPIASLAPRWHYLGAIQRRKVRDLAPYVSCWQSVSRKVEIDEIALHKPGAEIFVQVNVTGLPGRNGCEPVEVETVAIYARSQGLRLRGLMAVGALGGPEAARPGFKVLANLGARIGVDELSMGMSDDYLVAIEEGSTMVRLGRTLFGERPKRT